MAKIECTNEQLRLIQDALELYSRIGILQLDHILYHPSLDKMIEDQFRPKKDKLEIGDETNRGTIVEINKKSIKTKSQWSDWRDRADEATIKANPDGWVEEVREWKDIDKIKLKADWSKIHETRDKIKNLCSEIKNLISGDPSIQSPNASYGIYNNKLGNTNQESYNMIQQIRHEFWKVNPNKSNMTVDSSVCFVYKSKPIKVILDDKI